MAITQAERYKNNNKDALSMSETVEEIKSLSEKARSLRETFESVNKALEAQSKIDNSNVSMLEEQAKVLKANTEKAEKTAEAMKVLFSRKYGEEFENVIQQQESLVDALNDNLDRLKEERTSLENDTKMLASDRREKLKELDNEITSTRRAIKKSGGEEREKEKEEKETPKYSKQTQGLLDSLGSTSGGKLLNNFLQTGTKLFGGIKGGQEADDKVANAVNKLGGKSDTMLNVVKSISSGLQALSQAMDKAITTAANQMANFYGVIKANVENSAYTFESIQEKADEVLTANRFVKQVDYLNEIANLTNQGLVSDLETRALLDVISKKTLGTFNATEKGLTELIRLTKLNQTTAQFGLELQLKRVLNSVFQDHSYLNGLYDAITGAIQDADISTTSDITTFNSTIQTWLGAMYESGMSGGIVESIAKGINSLGSGNVSALASDESTQRLFLLAMDRIGMDFADVLQQGLTASETNQLLNSTVQYLNEIATNTSDNLVLKSSYSNLFNLSVSDMRAIQNLASKADVISSSIVNTAQANAITKDAVTNIVQQNTLASEAWENVFANLQYSFGSNIAQNNGLYNTYRIADITYDMLDAIASVPGVVGKVASAGQMVAAATKYAVGIAGFLPLLGDLGSFKSESLSGLLSMTPGGAGVGASMTGYVSEADQGNFKSMNSSVSSAVESISTDTSELEEEVEDESLGILKELAKTLMKLENGEGYAFAVSLQGMNDEVLRSFASIFADEDAMMKTFSGDNKVLEDALFNYVNDTTSNSTEASTASTGTSV